VGEFQTDIIQRKLRVFDVGELEEVSLGDSTNKRHSEMAVETGNTYISEIVRDSKSKKVSASDCNNSRQPEIAICSPKPEITYISRTRT